jgi:arabinan endo-1,5-alpha-L-arabinosidase
MNCRWLWITSFLCIMLLGASSAAALDGSINIHDPSTVIECEGRYYVFGTGGGIPFLTSNDEFTWQRSGRVFSRIPESVLSAVPKNNGTLVWAPDIIKVNDTYYLYYAVSTWGSFVSAVGLMTNPTLNTDNPKYKWTDGGLVVNSVEGDNLNAIDPGVLRAPDGTLWLSYGSYHGNIELVQLDPKTGGRISPKSQVWIIASQSEASDIIYREGYYYLFVNHGSCCQGRNSTYNIRVGRSAKVTGPYLDRHGDDLAKGAGTLFLGAGGKQIGPGHFGRIIDNGVEKFSCHFEADLDRDGRSVLEIRPLLWTSDGWPMPGQNVKDGTYQVLSQSSGALLQENDAQTRPETGKYLIKLQQQWTISPAGGGFYKILNAQSKTALQAADDKSVGLAAWTGSDSQLWKVDQLADGSYRFESKPTKLALTSTRKRELPDPISLTEFTGDDTQRWTVAAP